MIEKGKGIRNEINKEGQKDRKIEEEGGRETVKNT
jgi:hypothetical protein